MVFFALRIGDAQNQHVLGQPAFVAAHGGGNAQRKAFLAEQRIAAVAGAIRPDFTRLWVMHDVLGLVARPFHVRLAGSERRAHGVHAGHKVAIGAQHVENRLAHARHDLHVNGDIGAVRKLDADMRNRRAQRAHAEGHNVHGAAAHGAVEQRLQGAAHLGRGHPVVGRTGVFFFVRTDVGAVFHARHVARVALRQKAVRAFRRVELFEGAAIDQLLAEPSQISFKIMSLQNT